MSDNDELKQKLNSFKDKKKKKITVPKEFLDNANSYDDKLMVVKMFTEKNKNSALLLFKQLLKDAVEERDKVGKKK
jgi:hypothetical protein